ncbi:WD repeat-containing protein 90 [Erinaceus europaeus]|uniref:WD repeat-containing protein 90 n=1 Tax=Erinaceus europaeus TaxID=9365 RepID=A0ABM3W0I6_ERIEU|nr:WD repeat-containing protein 90 [Erinaceus europaeus]
MSRGSRRGRRPGGSVRSPGVGGFEDAGIMQSGGQASRAAPWVSPAWQHPFVNVFRHFKVDEWKRSAKEGDVAAVMDGTLKRSVYRVRGAVSASNYVQLPQTSSQSLGLTGRYLYVLFRPLPAKHFLIHLDVAAEDGQVVRVSFSNLFKEFKSTATWLQFPFVCEVGASGRGNGRVAREGLPPLAPRWTCLQLDLRDTLLLYLNRRYGHLKSVRLCASLLVRNLYTSDLSFDPAVTVVEARRAKLAVTPVPREMAFPVPSGESWHDRYVHVRFPGDGLKVPSGVNQKSPASPEAVFPGRRPQLLPRRGASSTPQDSEAQRPGHTVVSAAVSLGCGEGGPSALRAQAPLAPRSLAEGNPAGVHLCDFSVGGPHCPKRSSSSSAGSNSRKLAHLPTVMSLSAHQPSGSEQSWQEVAGDRTSPKQTSFLPDPLLRLKGVIGFGGHSTRWALWIESGTSVLYPCHAVIVLLQLDSREQRFLLGHTDKVCAMALDGSGSMLASAQARAPSMVRLWDVCSGDCLSLFRTPTHTISALSLSHSGALLCGVGKDRHGRTVVVAWGTEQVRRSGEVVLLAKVHTDVDIQAFEFSCFDETRMASCGRGSVRLWRLRGGELRSCSVDLGEHHALDFTDLAFGQTPDSHALYVSGPSGHILEVDVQRLAVQHARRLLPNLTPGSPTPHRQTFSSGSAVAIYSLSIQGALCAVGSEDGLLRLWPLDFSSVLLEAEHEGPVCTVSISPDGQRVLSTTSLGQLGFLDVLSREYHVLVRSHTAPVLGFAMDGSQGQLATVSQDGTVRIWDLQTQQQLYDFVSPADVPCAVAFHPKRSAFFCGFTSGAVRVCSLKVPEVLEEHRCHQGTITGLVASPDGSYLFSSCSQGTLAQYHCADHPSRVLRRAADMVWRATPLSPNALAVSGDSRLLAFVGPSPHTVTVAKAASLDELLRVDVSALDLTSGRLDFAVAVSFGPVPPGHLLVSTSSPTVLVLDSVTGRVLRELSGLYPAGCPSLALSGDARFLLMAADQAVKVWEHSTQAGPSCQVYIGHSEPVRAVSFTPDQRQVLSAGDAVFLWDILVPAECSPPGRQVPPPHVTDLLWPSLFSSIPGSPRVPLAPETGPGAAQLESAMPEVGGDPLQQVPTPAQVSQSWLGLLTSSEGTSSDSREAVQQSPGLPGLHQVPDPPALVQQADRTATRGCNCAPCPHSWLTARSPRKAEALPVTRPDCYKHFTARYKVSQPAKSVSRPPAGSEQLLLKAVVGYNGNGRANLVWSPDTGFFAYTCGCLVVVEDLHSGAQRHWVGHPEEVSTLALSHNAQILASASGHGPAAPQCHLYLWDVPSGSFQQLRKHHHSAVQALAFSPDDRFLITLGDYCDRALALWSTATCELLASTVLLEPAHSVAFSPWDAGRLACVGPALTFWRLQQHGASTGLQVHQAPVPKAVGVGELTSMCFGAEPLLYCGSNCGQVCVWDMLAQRCFLTWEADDGEIGVLQCSGTRLVSGSNTRRLRLWAVGAVQELCCRGSSARSSSVSMERELSLDGAVVSAVFHGSMDMGVVGTTAGTLWYVSWAEGTSTRLVSGHRSKVNEVAFSPDESHCATCGEDGSVRVWALGSMELLIQFQVLNQSCLCLVWSPPSCGRPEQQQVAAGYSDGTLRVFSISRTAMELKMRPHAVALTAIAFSTDGQTLLSGDKDGLVAVNRPRTGMTLRVLRDHQSAPISTLQSTGKPGEVGVDLWLAASGDQRVSVWVSDWLRDRCELHDWLSFPAPVIPEAAHPPPSLAAFCPWNPALLVCAGLGSDPQLLFYSLRRKQVVRTVPLPCFAISLSLSPSPCVLAIGFAERLLSLLDCASGAWQDFLAHEDGVQLCRFTPSSQLLFTAAHSEILVWEVFAGVSATCVCQDPDGLWLEGSSRVASLST